VKLKSQLLMVNPMPLTLNQKRSQAVQFVAKAIESGSITLGGPSAGATPEAAAERMQII
jgi:hypothetical protein